MTEVARDYHKAGKRQRQAEENWVLDQVVRGRTHREIAKELGVSARTVATRQTKALERTTPVSVGEYRRVMNEQLDHLFDGNLRLLEAGDEKAIERAIRIIERKAKLNGVDAPILVDATVTEVTAQERQLADLLAQAERDEKAREDTPVEAEA